VHSPSFEIGSKLQSQRLATDTHQHCHRSRCSFAHFHLRVLQEREHELANSREILVVTHQKLVAERDNLQKEQHR